MFESLFRSNQWTMLMRYFPNITRAMPLTRLRIVRLLPKPGEVIVRRGQQVTAGQIVARCPEKHGYHVYNASEALQIPPEDLPNHLLVSDGDQIFRGKPLVRKKGGLGRRREYRSAIDGVFDGVRDGHLILRQYPRRLELRAMVGATVTGIMARRGVVLESEGTLLDGLWHSGHESFGRLQILTRAGDEALDLTRSDGALRDSVVVAGRITRPDVLDNLIKRGVAGVVTGSLHARACAQVVEAGLAVLLTDGIGQRPMAAPLFELLAQAEGKLASLLDGGMDVYQGRPQVVIPTVTEMPLPEEPEDAISLDIGQTVRVWRREQGPHVGRLVHVFAGARQTEVGLFAPGAQVELSDGTLIDVPLTNLDLLVMG
jgi:hypothetical protein